MKIKQSELTKIDWRVVFRAMRMLRDFSPATLDSLIDARITLRRLQGA